MRSGWKLYPAMSLRTISSSTKMPAKTLNELDMGAKALG
jgi:hypothetical protein